MNVGWISLCIDRIVSFPVPYPCNLSAIMKWVCVNCEYCLPVNSVLHGEINLSPLFPPLHHPSISPSIHSSLHPYPSFLHPSIYPYKITILSAAQQEKLSSAEEIANDNVCFELFKLYLGKDRIFFTVCTICFIHILGFVPFSSPSNPYYTRATAISRRYGPFAVTSSIYLCILVPSTKK